MARPSSGIWLISASAPIHASRHLIGEAGAVVDHPTLARPISPDHPLSAFPAAAANLLRRTSKGEGCSPASSARPLRRKGVVTRTVPA